VPSLDEHRFLVYTTGMTNRFLQNMLAVIILAAVFWFFGEDFWTNMTTGFSIELGMIVFAPIVVLLMFMYIERNQNKRTVKLTGDANVTLFIELDNGHKYDVTVNGKWQTVKPHQNLWTKEEEADGSVDREYREVMSRVMEEIERRRDDA
jgi:hypothetical protein